MRNSAESGRPKSDPNTQDALADSTGIYKAIALPIKVELRNLNWYAYVIIPSGREFRTKKGTSQYGWVRLDGSNNSLGIMGASNLWMAQVIIEDRSNDRKHYGENVSGHMEKEKAIDVQMIAMDALNNEDKKKRLAEIVQTGYTAYLARVAASPLQPAFIPPLPSGRFREAWLFSEEKPEDLKFEETKKEYQALRAGLKSAGQVGRHSMKAKEEVYKYGNMEQQDAEVTFKTSKGAVIDRKTPFFQWSGARSVEYPFCKPASFKLTKKRFNALADQAPSTILQPIRMWVEAIGDVEEHAVYFILGVWRMINIFQK